MGARDVEGGAGGGSPEGAEWARACNFKIREISRMFEDEMGRLRAVAAACDQLKKSTTARLESLAMSVNEVANHQEYLKTVTKDGNLPQTPSSETGCLEYVLNRIDDLYDINNNQFKVSKAVRQSVLNIRFLETSLGSKHKEDEIVLDLGSDHKYPADLMIASRTIQDLIVQQIVNHPLAKFAEPADKYRQTIAVPDVAAPLMSLPPTPDNSPRHRSSSNKDNHPSPDPDTDPARATPLDSSPPPSSLSTSAPAPGLTWSQVSKMNCPTKAGNSAAVALLPKPERLSPETNRPHCYFDCHSVKNNKSFRFVIRVRPDKAPFMSENFIRLTLGKRGFGYKGSKFFRCKPDDHVVMGDFERNDGSGGRSAYTSRYFLAEQCPLKDHKGAVRMRGMERTADGRCKVGSQFMVWVGDIDYKEYRFTLVFGEVTQGLKYLQDISRIGMMYSGHETWLLKEDVIITDCGVL